MKFRPLHDRVLIESLESEEKQLVESLFQIQQRKTSGRQGNCCWTWSEVRRWKTIPMDVKVGDRVLFGKWSGTEVKVDGKEYSIMKESDIMGVVGK